MEKLPLRRKNLHRVVLGVQEFVDVVGVWWDVPTKWKLIRVYKMKHTTALNKRKQINAK